MNTAFEGRLFLYLDLMALGVLITICVQGRILLIAAITIFLAILCVAAEFTLRLRK